MNLSSQRTIPLATWLAAIVALAGSTAAYVTGNGVILLAFAILSNLFCLYQYSRSQPLLIVTAFMMLNVIYLIPYFWFNINLAAYQVAVSEYGHTLFLHTLFLLCLVVFSRKLHPTRRLVDGLTRYNNTFLLIVSLLIMWFIIAFGKTGETIYQSGGYGSTSTAGLGGLALYEYFGIFVIGAFLFSKGSRAAAVVIHISALVYCLKSLLLGGRIEVIEVIILLFILYWDQVFPTRIILCFFVIGWILVNLMGSYRSDPSGFATDIWPSMVQAVTGYNPTLHAVVNNQGDVFYSSSAFLYVLDGGAWSLAYRLGSFATFVAQIFLPSRYLNSSNILSTGVKQYLATGGGGLVDIHFYVWFGYAGLIVAAGIIAFVFHKGYSSHLPWVAVYAILFCAMSPRWFSYGPTPMVKVCLFGVIYYGLCMLLHRSIARQQPKPTAALSVRSHRDSIHSEDAHA